MFKKIIYQVYMLQFPSFKPGHVKAPPKPLPKPLPKPVAKPQHKVKTQCMVNAVTYLMTK